MMKMMLRKNAWNFLFLALVFASMGLGFQLGQTHWLGESLAQEVAHSPLVCQDGSLVKDHIRLDQQKALGQLTEFGEKARSIWKDCVCDGFQGIGCTALQIELEDEMNLSWLDSTQ